MTRAQQASQAQREYLSYPWNRDRVAELRKDGRPIVVQLAPRSGKGHPCRQVTSHTGLFVHVVDHLAELGLLRMTMKLPTRWEYELAAETPPTRAPVT